MVSTIDAYNAAASYLFAGISGRLCGEIVHPAVNDHRPTDNLLYRKTVGKKYRQRIAVIAEQRQQVTSVRGMRTSTRIIMPTDRRKNILSIAVASTPLVDMKAEHPMIAFPTLTRKSHDFCKHQHPVSCLIKAYRSP